MCHRMLYNVDGWSNKSANNHHNDSIVTIVLLTIGDDINEDRINDRNKE